MLKVLIIISTTLHQFLIIINHTATAYFLQLIVQDEKYDHKLVTIFCLYLNPNEIYSDIYVLPLTYAYNTPIRKAKSSFPFNFMLLNLPAFPELRDWYSGPCHYMDRHSLSMTV